MSDVFRILKRLLKRVYLWLIRSVPFLRSLYDSLETQSPILLRMVIIQKVLGFNRYVPWPVHFTSKVTGWEFITLGIAASPGFMGGCYVFAKEDAPIEVGDYTIISANVCLAGYNHDIYDYTKFHSKGGIKIGRYCWIGMNASIMPGVTIGDHTIVAAGAVVTNSFSEGYCMLAGVPAKVIRRIDPDRCVEHRTSKEFIGFKRVSSL